MTNLEMAEKIEDLEKIKWRIFSAQTSLSLSRVREIIGEESYKELSGCLKRSYLMIDNLCLQELKDNLEGEKSDDP